MANFNNQRQRKAAAQAPKRGQGFQGRKPSASPQGPGPSEDMNKKLGDMSRAMGVHPGFAEQIDAEGEEAVNKFVEDVDQNGEVAKLMRLVQKFGNWLEERTARGKQPSQGEMKEVITKLSKDLGVPTDIALQVASKSLEKVKGATAKLSEAAQAKQKQSQGRVQNG